MVERTHAARLKVSFNESMFAVRQRLPPPLFTGEGWGGGKTGVGIVVKQHMFRVVVSCRLSAGKRTDVDLPPSQPSPAGGGRSGFRTTEHAHAAHLEVSFNESMFAVRQRLPPSPFTGEGWGGGTTGAGIVVKQHTFRVVVSCRLSAAKRTDVGLPPSQPSPAGGGRSRSRMTERTHAARLKVSLSESMLAAFGFTSQNLPT